MLANSSTVSVSTSSRRLRVPTRSICVFKKLSNCNEFICMTSSFPYLIRKPAWISDALQGQCRGGVFVTANERDQSFYSRFRRIRFLSVFLTNNFVAGRNHCPSLSQPLAGRTVLQVDQTALAMAFYRTTPNALKTQIWIAISVYLLVAIANIGSMSTPVSTEFSRSSAWPFSKKPPRTHQATESF